MKVPVYSIGKAEDGTTPHHCEVKASLVQWINEHLFDNSVGFVVIRTTLKKDEDEEGGIITQYDTASSANSVEHCHDAILSTAEHIKEKTQK